MFPMDDKQVEFFVVVWPLVERERRGRGWGLLGGLSWCVFVVDRYARHCLIDFRRWS